MADIKFSQFTVGGNVEVGDIVVGLRSGANYQFDFPGVGIKDDNGKYLLQYSSAGVGAVNYPLISSSLTADPVVYTAGGTDAAISLSLVPVGAGHLIFDGLNWPTSDGAAAQVLSTDGAGNLGWSTVASESNVVAWSVVSGTTQAAATNNGYIVTNSSLTTVTLPATAAAGKIVAIQGQGSGGWSLVANTGQTIELGASATSSGGSLSSVNRYDTVEVICIVANTTWGTRFTLSAGLTVA